MGRLLARCACADDSGDCRDADWLVPGCLLEGHFAAALGNNVRLHTLIALHLTRFVGFYFMVCASRGRIPAAWAIPAGIGDNLVAAGAVALLALGTRPRWLIVFWNSFGLVDILFVVVSAMRFGLRDWNSMAFLRELPLSLLPTFLVPLIIATHLVIFWRVARKSS